MPPAPPPSALRAIVAPKKLKHLSWEELEVCSSTTLDPMGSCLGQEDTLMSSSDHPTTR